MSNAADNSTVTQIVRSGSFLSLNPIAMSVAICNRAKLVECSGLKPCWSGARMSSLLIGGENRYFRTFATGQRGEIGR